MDGDTEPSGGATTIPATTADSATEERRLVAGLQAGDAAAYETLVREYGPRMLSVARRFLPDENDALDALQDAFLSAFKAMDGFQEHARLSTWLHRIVVNASLMKLRRRKRRPERSIEDLLPKYLSDGHMANPVERWAVTYDTAVQDRETREFVRQAIADLPESHRTVLLLRDIEEKTTDETAEILQIQPGAVKTRLHRARQALKTLLDTRMQGDMLS